MRTITHLPSRFLRRSPVKNKLPANVFSVVKPFFGDAGLDYGHIAEHLHIHRSNFKRQEFVLAGFKIA